MRQFIVKWWDLLWSKNEYVVVRHNTVTSGDFPRNYAVIRLCNTEYARPRLVKIKAALAGPIIDHGNAVRHDDLNLKSNFMNNATNCEIIRFSPLGIQSRPLTMVTSFFKPYSVRCWCFCVHLFHPHEHYLKPLLILNSCTTIRLRA